MWGRLLISGAAGLILGGALAIGAVFGPVELGGISSGPWRTNALIGSSEANGITRAIVARRGLLALNREETVYFTAWEDSSGRRLDEDCAYQLLFETEPQARWWSITLYAEDDFLAVNGADAHSVSADDFAEGAVLPYEVPVAAAPSPDPFGWISPQNGGAFSLTLRLYHPDPAISADPSAAILPAIERLSCGGAS